MLIATGVDINAENEIGETPLTWATQKGHIEIVQFLIQKGIALDTKHGAIGYTPLMLAIGYKQTKIGELLINAGADIHIKDIYGNTAQLLIEAGAKK